MQSSKAPRATHQFGISMVAFIAMFISRLGGGCRQEVLLHGREQIIRTGSVEKHTLDRWIILLVSSTILLFVATCGSGGTTPTHVLVLFAGSVSVQGSADGTGAAARFTALNKSGLLEQS